LTANPTAPVHLLDQLLTQRTLETATDADLLDRFIGAKEEAAFAAIVARHGPMVLRLCRRVLADSHAADDAFQATFLVLARHAASVRRPEALAGWLLGVASRVARKARAALARRRLKETSSADLEALDVRSDPLAEVSARELLAIFEDELHALPEVYRLPVILCCVEGHTQEETARMLGWTPGSVKGRLERGRARLHARLERRGLSLSAALVAIEASRTLSAATLAPLAAAAVRTALAGAASAEVLALAHGALPALALPRLALGALVLLLGLLAAGTFAAKEEQHPLPTVANADPPKDPDAREPQPGAQGEPLPASARLRLGSTWLKHRDRALAAAWSPDGKLMATSGQDNTVRVWDLSTGKQRFCLDNLWNMDRLGFSPDGTILSMASRSSRSACRCDTATGKRVLEVMGEDDKVRKMVAELSRIPALEATPENERFVLPGGFEPPLAYSADGKLCAYTKNRAEVAIFDTVTRKKLCEVREPGVGHLAFSPDKRTLATVGYQSFVRLWDVETGQERPRPPEHSQACRFVAFSPDGRTLATVGDDRALNLWDADTGRHRWKFGLAENEWHQGRFALFSLDGKTISANQAFYKFTAWDVDNGKIVSTVNYGPYVGSVVDSPNGRLRAIEEGYTPDLKPPIRLIEIESGRQLGWINPPEERHSQLTPGRIAFSPDGSLLAVVNFRNRVRLYGLHNLKEARCIVDGQEDRRQVTALAFSPDGRVLATSCRRIPERHEIWFPKPNADDAVRIWDTATGARLLEITGHEAGVTTVAFSPDGRIVASGSEDGTVRIWEAVTGKELLTLRDKGGKVHHVAFSPDGQRVASAMTDGSALVWELKPLDWKVLGDRLTEADLKRLWADLGSDKGPIAFAAIWTLAARPEAVPFLATHLKPAPAADPERVRRLIAALDDAEFERRERAARELAELGVRAETELRKALAAMGSAEVGAAVKRLLDALPDKWTVKDADAQQTVHAIWALERAGNREARSLLEALAGGAPEERQTVEAKAALARLAKHSPARPRS
jgi:RNA polymerase sigma factor (sigma-70 family)